MDLPTKDTLIERLKTVLSREWTGDVAVSRLTPLSVGFSWWTWTFDAVVDGATIELVLRLGPDSGLLAPYSSKPEASAMSALAGSGVPVPVPVAFSDDTSDFGAPYLISQKLGGHALIPWRISKMDERSKAPLRPIAHEFVEMLATINAPDTRDAYCAQMGMGAPGEAGALTQLEFWRDRVVEGQDRPHPIMEFAEDWLRRHAPENDQVALCHGDYRIGNFLVEDDRVSAILDWEMVHLGDRHQDLAWALLPPMALRELVTTEQVYETYQAAGGAPVDVDKIRYFDVLNHYKMVAINTLGRRNFLRGSGDVRVAILANMVPSQIAQLQRSIRQAEA